MRLRPGLALAVLALGLPIGPAARSVDATAPAPVVDSVRACPPAPAKHVACQSRVLRVGGAIVHPEVAHGRVLAAAGASFTGLTPSQVRAAYGITGDGAGQTVAVVGAFDNPSITGSGSDNLATYRTMYGLPPCTTGNGCFRKVDENGGTGYTAGDNGWNLEMDLDTQAVSAIAPGAHILLVETAAEDLADVVTAVGTAARLGATEISLSLGGAEFTGETGNDSAFLHQGVFVSAASGDAGFGAQYPAAASTVSSIGGTTLAQDSSARGWSETVWSGTGGGCSAFEAKPSWQRDPLCTKRTTNDVAADGDPQSGLAVYDAGSWIVVGGTSLSTPLIAGMVAVGGGGGDAVGAQGFYAEPSSSFNDVTSGSNGCGGAICRASAGFDSPTGFGSPAGAPAPLAYPTAAVSPPSLAFGGQTLGTTSASKGVVLSASNGGDLHVSTAAVSGPFAITSNGCSGAVLSGSQTCSVSVDFTPGGVGPQSGSLVISSDAGNGAQTVTLGGTGVGVPGASVPSSASAGTVTLGQGSSVGVTVTSTGSGPLVMGTSQISGSGAFLLGGSTCTSGTSVAPGTACTITVVFSPAAAGPASATLTIHDSAASSPQSVALTGTAVAAPPPQPPPVPGSPPPPPPVATGYWLTGADGSVYPFGAARQLGSTAGQRLNNPIVGMAATPDHGGYWLVASDGGIFPFGDATGHGSTGAVRLNRPIVGMAATASGRGYWLVASDGGIFPFGDAGGFGSTGSVRLNQPIVGMAPTPDGQGYWLVAADGGIFPFGDAGGYGSTGGIRLNRPVVGMTPTADGRGYWLDASDGGIFPFGDATGHGSTGAIRLNSPMVGMAATRDGQGYWLVASDGGIFPFGDAAGFGSTGGRRLPAPVVGMQAI